MKNLIATLIFLLTPVFTFATTIEEIAPQDYVTDYTQTLTSEQVLELSTILGNLEKEKNIQVAVVVVPNLSGDYIENFAFRLYEKLGIGSAEKDEGMLFIISKDERVMRMEVGYGLEPILTDGITKAIQDEIVSPQFKNGNYYEGIKLGLEKVFEVLNGGEFTPKENGTSNFPFELIAILFFVAINVLGWFVAIMARTKSWWLGGVVVFVLSIPFLIYFSFNLIADLLVFFFTLTGFIFDYFISKNYKYWETKSFTGDKHGPAWWAGGTWGPGSGSFKSGGSSGFGGFGGGGMSGGGGSSSSW